MSYKRSRDSLTKEMEPRVYVIIGIIALMLLLLLLRAWYLQGVLGEHYKQLSENNRMSMVEIEAPRGLTYDRNGELLVNNVPTFYLYVDATEVKDLDGVSAKIEELVGIDKQLIVDRVKKAGRRSSVPVRGGLTLKQVAIIESHRLDMHGVKIEPGLNRNFLYGNTASHMMGYVGEITERQRDLPDLKGVSVGTIIGQSGVEKTYNKYLVGEAGKKIVEKNAYGVEKRVLSTFEAKPGNDIELTIDIDIQQLAEKLMGDRHGVIVIMDVENGEIITSVSSPNYPPNTLSRPMTTKKWLSILNDPGHPLTNKAVQGGFPPGSVFKIVMAVAGLDSGVITKEETIQCYGHFRMGKKVFMDWKKSGHGETDLHKALVESCDVYFYKLGQKLGVDTVAKYARMFGFGNKTGIELTSENAGLIPDKRWKLDAKGEKWFSGETVSVSIGQGYVSVTPLQVAVMVSAMANGGTIYKPMLLRKAFGVEGETIIIKPQVVRKIKISDKIITNVNNALRDVVIGEHGTGKKARSHVAIAGKTGTAQVVSMKRDDSKAEVEDEFKDHAWFAAFAPFEKPKIAVVVLVEHGGHGGSTSAPIAKALIEAYVKKYPADDLKKSKSDGLGLK